MLYGEDFFAKEEEGPPGTGGEIKLNADGGLFLGLDGERVRIGERTRHQVIAREGRQEGLEEIAARDPEFRPRDGFPFGAIEDKALAGVLSDEWNYIGQGGLVEIDIEPGRRRRSNENSRMFLLCHRCQLLLGLLGR